MLLDGVRITASNRMSSMGDNGTTSLLILQDREMNLERIERSLESLPRERESIQKKIAAFESEIEAGKQRIKEMEVRGKAIETEMGEVENQALKYKSQQLDVKKNEEYTALTLEIELAEAKVSSLEETELELLYELDDARETQAEDEAEIKEKIEMESRALKRLDEKEINLKSEIDAACEAVGEAESQVEKLPLSIYRRVARGLKYPIIVPLRDAKCQGCHMRVSATVEVEARKANEITTCDNCGRIVYWDA